jgi:hypothetical protein
VGYLYRFWTRVRFSRVWIRVQPYVKGNCIWLAGGAREKFSKGLQGFAVSCNVTQLKAMALVIRVDLGEENLGSGRGNIRTRYSHVDDSLYIVYT